jgi:hypothetical protein
MTVGASGEGTVNKKRKIGILLSLVGIGIPLVLFFFRTDDNFFRLERKPTLRKQLHELEGNTLKAFVNVNVAINGLSVAVKEKEKKGLTDDELTVYEKASYLKTKIDEMYSSLGIRLADSGDIIMPDGSRITPPPPGFELELQPPPVLINIPYRYSVGVGVLFLLAGLAFILFSFSPKGKIEETRKPDAP